MESLSPRDRDLTLLAARRQIDGGCSHNGGERGMSLEQIRAVDRIAMEAFGMPSTILMENAGRGAADWIIAHVAAHLRVVVLCGVGNNGGDGLVIARHLHAAGIGVVVWIIGEPSRMTADTASNYTILSKTRVPCRWFPAGRCFPGDSSDEETGLLTKDIAQADILIDALMGTGASGSPRGAMASAIRAANESSSRRFAIDIPSGLDGRTGLPNTPTFRAEATLTFVASKTGFESPSANPYVGRVIVLPIGVPPEVIDRAREVHS